MKWNDFNQNWEFQHGEPSSIPMLPQKKDTVSLPHDFMIAGDVSPKAPGGAETGFYTGGVGSYTKYLDLTEDELCERHILHVGGYTVESAAEAGIRDCVSFGPALIMDGVGEYGPWMESGNTW